MCIATGKILLTLCNQDLQKETTILTCNVINGPIVLDDAPDVFGLYDLEV